MCGEERFCPQPPTYKAHIEFSNISEIISFPGFPQIFAITYGDEGFIFISKTHNGGQDIANTLISIREEFSQSSIDEDFDLQSNMKHVIDKNLKHSLESVIDMTKGKPIFIIYCSLNPETSILSIVEGMKVFKRGTFCILTDQNFLFALDVNLKKWVLKTTADEDFHIEVPKVFSIRNQFELSQSKKASIKDEGDCKFYLDIDGSDNVFMFGDDFTLELFQRHVMKSLYAINGGKKTKPRVGHEKKGNT